MRPTSNMKQAKTARKGGNQANEQSEFAPARVGRAGAVVLACIFRFAQMLARQAVPQVKGEWC